MTSLTKARKEKIDFIIKLEKARCENSWDYERNCEYKHLKSAKRNAKIESIIDKKIDSLWNSIVKSCKVERQWDLPTEIRDYHNERYNNIKYDRFNNYERDLENLGLKLPKR